MKIEQKKFSVDAGWQILRSEKITPESYDLVLVFGSSALLKENTPYTFFKEMYPSADILMCSTAGEIIDTQVNDNTISLTAIQFDRSKIRTASIKLGDKSSLGAGKALASKLPIEDLKSILIISDGLKVNGSEFMEEFREFFPANVIITGGMAADGADFNATYVGLNEQPVQNKIAAIGFYGDGFTVTYGSIGGWDPFGVERLITKSDGNILYELDGKPALDIYKLYLGEYAAELPGAGLLFPLSIRMSDSDPLIVRTILSVNETDRSLIFAGNMPQGAYAQLMKANLDRLIEGASDAAVNSSANSTRKPELALLISCVGRKLVLDQRIEEEVEVIRTVYGNDTVLAGFYSYGEFSPALGFTKCELHNQTMTITTITED